jgi:hypothetical protein
MSTGDGLWKTHVKQGCHSTAIGAARVAQRRTLGGRSPPLCERRAARRCAGGRGAAGGWRWGAQRRLLRCRRRGQQRHSRRAQPGSRAGQPLAGAAQAGRGRQLLQQKLLQRAAGAPRGGCCTAGGEASSSTAAGRCRAWRRGTHTSSGGSHARGLPRPLTLFLLKGSSQALRGRKRRRWRLA